MIEFLPILEEVGYRLNNKKKFKGIKEKVDPFLTFVYRAPNSIITYF